MGQALHDEGFDDRARLELGGHPAGEESILEAVERLRDL
jgi:hypothetical protein